MKQNGFVELRQDEMYAIDGGLHPIVWMVIGWGVDAAVEGITGKDCKTWIEVGAVKAAKWADKCVNANNPYAHGVKP